MTSLEHGRIGPRRGSTLPLRVAAYVANDPWTGFLTRRLRRLAVSIWVLVSAAFFMIHLVPGDPVRAALGPTASPLVVAARRHQLGLDLPLWHQYLRFLDGALTGRFGDSIVSGLPVASTITQRLPPTLEIALPAFALVMLLALPAGITMAALTRGGRRSGAGLGFTAVTAVVGSIPNFLLAVVLVSVFAVRLSWFPVAERGGVNSYVLPVLSLSLGPAAVMARIVRSEVLTVLGNDYIRTARAKRLPARLIYLRHALPNALTATLTISGLLLTGLAAGTVLVENVFAWPGLGTVLVQSIENKDYPLVQGLILVYGGMILVVNLVVDVLIALLDRRSTLKES